jgi:hypothetical protein
LNLEEFCLTPANTLYKFAENREIWFPYLCGMAYIPFDARIAGSWSTPYGGGLGFWPREPV